MDGVEKAKPGAGWGWGRVKKECCATPEEEAVHQDALKAEKAEKAAKKESEARQAKRNESSMSPAFDTAEVNG